MMAAIPGPALAVRESFPKQMNRSLGGSWWIPCRG